MSPLAPDEPFTAALESCRRFLLAVANAGLPADLQAKGGASDLVQETMAAAHRSRHQFHGSSLGELRAWLRAILGNELAMFRRHYYLTAARDARREVSLVAAEGTQSGAEQPVAHLSRAERNRAVAVALARLPDPSRLVVTLRSGEGLAFAEIGARIGRSEEAARKLWVRALEQLRGLVPAGV